MGQREQIDHAEHKYWDTFEKDEAPSLAFSLKLIDANGGVLFDEMFNCPQAGFNSLKKIHKYVKLVRKAYPSAVRMITDIAL